MTKTNQLKTNESNGFVDGLIDQLFAVLPFSEMSRAHIALFIENCEEQYYESEEIIIEPNAGCPKYLYFIRQGAVYGQRDSETDQRVCFELDAGEMFSIGAALTNRPVASVYRAVGDTFCLLFPVTKIHELGVASQPFIAFLQDRFRYALQKSHQDLQQQFAAKAAEVQIHQSTLGSLISREPISVLPDTPLREALTTMDEQRIGSILITDKKNKLLGILTRHDLLKRVVLVYLDYR